MDVKLTPEILHVFDIHYTHKPKFKVEIRYDLTQYILSNIFK
jgi:hypothetical protein